MSFTFLSEDEDRALSYAMRKCQKKIEAVVAAAAAEAAKRPLEKGASFEAQAEEEEDLNYTWWERNYDDDFTRRRNLSMTQEANWKAVMTCRPELATYDGGASGFEAFRAVAPEESDACFDRLWGKAQKNVQHRMRVRRRSYVEGDAAFDETAEAAAASSPGGGIGSKPRRMPPPMRLTSPEAVAMLTRRLASMATPKERPAWDNPLCTFSPVLLSSAVRRARALSRLPPLKPPDADQPRNHPPMERRLPRMLPAPTMRKGAGKKKKKKKGRRGKISKTKKLPTDDQEETGENGDNEDEEDDGDTDGNAGEDTGSDNDDEAEEEEAE